MLLLFGDTYIPPTPLLGVPWFRDDFRFYLQGQQISGDGFSYQKILQEGFSVDAFATTSQIPGSPGMAMLSTGAGAGYTVQALYIPRAMRPVRDCAIKVRFFQAYSSAGNGLSQPGPSVPGHDGDSLLVVRWVDSQNFILLHPQRYTKQFLLIEVVNGIATSQYLGNIEQPGYQWLPEPWRPTIFDTLSPLLWDVSIVGRRLIGAIKYADFPSSPPLFTFDRQLISSNKGRVGVGSRIHFSGYAAWEWIDVYAISSGILTIGSRRGLRRSARGGEDGRNSRT